VYTTDSSLVDSGFLKGEGRKSLQIEEKSAREEWDSSRMNRKSNQRNGS